MNKSLLSWTVVCLRVSQVALVIKNPPATAGELRDVGPSSGWGRSPGGGHLEIIIVNIHCFSVKQIFTDLISLN